MGDKNPPQSPSFRVLVRDISEKLDRMSDAVRQDTIYADIRPSDARTFFVIAGGPRGLTELARAVGVSRQVTHRSIQRLKTLGLVDFDYAEGSRRDMIASLTDAGREAQQTGRQIGQKIDREIAARLGETKTEALRDLLTDLRQSLLDEVP